MVSQGHNQEGKLLNSLSSCAKRAGKLESEACTAVSESVRRISWGIIFEKQETLSLRKTFCQNLLSSGHFGIHSPLSTALRTSLLKNISELFSTLIGQKIL